MMAAMSAMIELLIRAGYDVDRFIFYGAFFGLAFAFLLAVHAGDLAYEGTHHGRPQRPLVAIIVASCVAVAACCIQGVVALLNTGSATVALRYATDPLILRFVAACVTIFAIVFLIRLYRGD